MGRLGIWEILLILLVVMLLFGAKKLPELARSLGEALKEFKSATKNIEKKVREPDDESSA